MEAIGNESDLHRFFRYRQTIALILRQRGYAAKQFSSISAFHQKYPGLNNDPATLDFMACRGNDQSDTVQILFLKAGRLKSSEAKQILIQRVSNPVHPKNLIIIVDGEVLKSAEEEMNKWPMNTEVLQVKQLDMCSCLFSWKTNTYRVLTPEEKTVIETTYARDNLQIPVMKKDDPVAIIHGSSIIHGFQRNQLIRVEDLQLYLDNDQSIVHYVKIA